jgi:cellulose synthase/poly-beta-1,6-N-acetylglucosamine synthase-like glycosyltransferase
MDVEVLIWLIRFSLVSGILYMILIGLYTLGWYGLSRDEQQNETETSAEQVSVVVAFRNEEQHLESLLNHLSDQDFDQDKTEIILIDDHSDDSSAEIVKRFIHHNPKLNIRLLHSDAQGKKEALKKGIHGARYSLLLFTDADCKPGRHWISTMVSHMSKHDHVMAIGPVMLEPVSGHFGRMQGLEYLSLMASTAGSAGLGIPAMSNGANVVVRREALDKTGNDSLREDIASGDDVFMMFALIKAFGRRSVSFVRQEKAIMPTPATENRNAFFRQRSRWVSKSRAYADPLIIIPALIVGFFNIFLAIILPLALFYPALTAVYLLLMLLKTMTDYPLLLAGARFIGRTQWLWYVVPVQLVYPFYVLVSVFIGLFLPVRWKGRTLG